MSLSEPTLDTFGALLIEHVRDLTIGEVDSFITNREKPANSEFARKIRGYLAAFDAQQLESLKRLVPIIVDTTLHDILWMLEQWDSVQLSVRTENGAMADVRKLTVGELQGYLFDWIARFSKQRYEPFA